MYVRRLATFSRPVQVSAPVPGIQTDRSFEFRKHPGAEIPPPGTPFEKLRDEGFIVCGDPDYVSEWLANDMKTAGYGHFLDERRLSDKQIDLIRQWSEKGAPELPHWREGLRECLGLLA